MNKKNIIYTLTTSFVLALGSCASEDFWDTFDRTVDGPIDFTVGVESSPAQHTRTRAAGDVYSGTKILVRVDGTWKGKTETRQISQTAVCSTTGSTLSYDGTPLYWDDYGIGDPENAENRTAGLKVYGVAVEGNADAPEVNSWTALSWSTVDENGNAVVNSNNKLSKDIIISNNLSAYSFDNRDENKMVFNHVLSKITFNITANNGFPETGKGQTKYKFSSVPTLTLTSATSVDGAKNNGGAYALTEGTIDIEKCKANVDASETKKNIVAGTTDLTNSTITVVKEAIVYPGTFFGASDDAVIAQLNADGNIYYIKADKIRNKMYSLDNGTDYKTEAGKNYVINITVNKSGISMTATVADWTIVNSAESYPKIDVTVGVGNNTVGIQPTDFTAFDFWMSESKANGYGLTAAATPTGEADGTKEWDFGVNKLYWTHHSQHFHFRGIFPVGTTVVNDTNGNQVVAISNCDYDETKFPCNFLMGMPEIGADEECDNKDHDPVKMSEYGICAREAAINLNFIYMMSQIEVVLSSSESTAADNVDLSNVEVELVNVYKTANILMKDRSSEGTGSVVNYVLKLVDPTNHKYLSAIVPQGLVYTSPGDSGNVRIKITVTNADSTKDIYYADVEPIKKKGESTKIAPKGKWESGYHYVYNLKVTKTKINATATLTDWKTVEAGQEVWF